MNHPPSQQARRLRITPRGGPVGAQVTVRTNVMPPLTNMVIGFGSLSQHQILARTSTDGDGAFEETVTVPEWAERDKVHFFFVAFADMQPRGFSDGYHVTAADGTARVRGEISEEAGACTAVRGVDELYTLIGDTRDWRLGARVAVTGTIVDGAPCGDQGIAIAVADIQAL